MDFSLAVIEQLTLDRVNFEFPGLRARKTDKTSMASYARKFCAAFAPQRVDLKSCVHAFMLSSIEVAYLEGIAHEIPRCEQSKMRRPTNVPESSTDRTVFRCGRPGRPSEYDFNVHLPKEIDLLKDGSHSVTSDSVLAIHSIEIRSKSGKRTIEFSAGGVCSYSLNYSSTSPRRQMKGQKNCEYELENEFTCSWL